MTASRTLCKRKILLVFDVLELGGAERQGLLLARHLTREVGADVEVWGFRTPGRVARLCEEIAIPWRLVSATWPPARLSRLRSLARLVRTLRGARPDVILSYTLRPNVLCGAVWPLSGATACIWNQRDAGLERLGRRIERWAVGRVSRFVANSRPSLAFLVEELGVPRARVEIVANGVMLDPPVADGARWRKDLGLASEDFAACMVANFHVFKDHETVLRAWQRVAEHETARGRRAVLLLAGYPYLPLDGLKGLVGDLGLAHHVRFLGQVVDVAGLLQACDLSVLSSRHEGCPNAILEAMAAGLPIVATDNPGTRDVLGAEGDPLLAPPGDAEAFAVAILRLAADPALRVRQGESNRRRAATEYAADRMCDRMTTIIAGALESGRTPE